MAKDRFTALVAALWAELDQPAPAPRADGFAFTVDGQALRLAPTPDGRSVLVSADVGSLSDDPPRAADQVRALLETGMGLVLSCTAAVAMRPGRRPGDPDIVAVEAIAPCDPRAVAPLKRAIEDVLALAEAHGPTLAARRSATVRPTARSAPVGDEMIFRL